ncbi:MAG: putative cytosolic protein [Deltaproteobacteria bacterium]|nr:putative cytosolic protein [Deltaproteobacteria bacterium]
MKATQQLKDEHEGVRTMLRIIEKICDKLETAGSIDKEHFDGVLEFLRVFVDKCHHGKEEELLFPALVAAGVPEDGPIAVMLREHETGRGYVRAMSHSYSAYVKGDRSSSKDIMQNAHGCIGLLRDHIEKENNVLFVMADDRLSEKKQDELFEGFEKIEQERIGVGKHEEFHDLIKRLSAIYSK